MANGFRCNCPQCQARYDLCPAARELEQIITDLTRERDEARELRNEYMQKELRVRLERDRLRVLLREVQWQGGDRYRDHCWFCPCCGAFKEDGHAPDCRLAAALEGRDG